MVFVNTQRASGVIRPLVGQHRGSVALEQHETRDASAPLARAQLFDDNLHFPPCLRYYAILSDDIRSEIFAVREEVRGLLPQGGAPRVAVAKNFLSGITEFYDSLECFLPQCLSEIAADRREAAVRRAETMGEAECVAVAARAVFRIRAATAYMQPLSETGVAAMFEAGFEPSRFGAAVEVYTRGAAHAAGRHAVYAAQGRGSFFCPASGRAYVCLDEEAPQVPALRDILIEMAASGCPPLFVSRKLLHELHHAVQYSEEERSVQSRVQARGDAIEGLASAIPGSWWRNLKGRVRVLHDDVSAILSDLRRSDHTLMEVHAIERDLRFAGANFLPRAPESIFRNIAQYRPAVSRTIAEYVEAYDLLRTAHVLGVQDAFVNGLVAECAKRGSSGREELGRVIVETRQKLGLENPEVFAIVSRALHWRFALNLIRDRVKAMDIVCEELLRG